MNTALQPGTTMVTGLGELEGRISRPVTKGTVEWDVEHVTVGGETWTIASWFCRWSTSFCYGDQWDVADD
jgi:hypothetical protein